MGGDSQPVGAVVGVRRGEGLPRVAAAIAVSAWGLALSAVVALLAAGPELTAELWFFVVDVTVAVVYGAVAGVTLARRRHPVPWLLAVTALGGALAGLGYAYGQLALSGTPLPWVGAVASMPGIAWVPGTLSLFLVVPWLVRDHPLGRARWGLAAGAAVTTACTLSRLAGWDGAMDGLFPAVVLVGLAAAADAGWRWARGPVAERGGLGWLAIGTAVMALSFLPLAVPALGAALPFWLTPVLHLVAQAFFPAAVLVAVLRQRMWGIDLAVSRTVVAGLLTVALGVLYVAVTALAVRLLPGSGTAAVLAAAAVAVAVQPARLWLQGRVDRLVHGEAGEPDRVVRRLGHQLGRAETGEELLAGMAESVGTALRLESVTVTGDGLAPVGWGTPTGVPEVVELLHRGRSVGRLTVTPRPGEALDARARRSLAELAAVVAAGTVLASATEELERARDRLTSVRLQERRVLRRELHDGLGPSLAGIRLGLQGARNLLERDPAASALLIESLQLELDHRVEDVRALSRGLLPPALDELGLAAALAELSARYRDGGMTVEVRCSGTETLDPRLAAAAYGIVTEAVRNAMRHGGVDRCSVTVEAGRDLVVTVDDEGTGIPVDAPSGVGTRSMHERAEEQGGRLRIEQRSPRGTRVHARMPLVAT